jgi:hypothetical protein
VIGLEALRHALAVAEFREEQIGPDGFPLIGDRERGRFLLAEVTDLITGLDCSTLIEDVRAARAAAERDSNDEELEALRSALDTALWLLDMPESNDDLFNPEDTED